MRLATGPSPEAEVNFRGGRFIIPTSDVTILPSLMLGDYETTALDAFLRLVSSLAQGSSVVDVGANIGIYSVLASIAMPSGGNVYAFEPATANIDLLERNLAINNIRNVSILRKAVGASAGRVKLFTSSSDIGTHSLGGSSGSNYEEVTMIALDDFVQESGINVGAIKVDVEGWDGFVMAGAADLLAKQRPTLLIEYAPTALESCGYSARQFSETLFALPGTRYWVDERHRNLLALTRPADLEGIAWNAQSSSNILVTESADVILDMVKR